MNHPFKTIIASTSKYTITVVATFLAATALIVGSTAVVHAKHHGEKTPEQVVERMTEKLSLDTNQQSALRVLIDEKRKLKAERKAKREARKAEYKAAKESGKSGKKGSGPFSLLADKDQITLADVNKIIDEKHAERQERRQPALQAFVDFRNSLSKAQREQARSKLRKMLRGIMGKGNKGKGKKKTKKNKQG